MSLGNVSSLTLTPVTSVSQEYYRPAIDGLRAVAVVAVFIFHLNRQWLPGGFVGVDVFFVISGYLITSILLRDYKRKGFSLAKFYQRRIARLFPAFFAVGLATLLGGRVAPNLSFAALSLANLKFMWQGSYFTLSPDAQPLLHYWSLSVEEQFYLLFPVTLLLLYGKINRYKTAVLAALGGLSLIVCIAVTRVKPEWAFFLLPTRAWELLAGAVLASLSTNHPKRENAESWKTVSLLGVILICASLIVIHQDAGFPGYLAVLPVLGTVLVLRSAMGAAGLAESVLSARPVVLVGRMSYSLYLWHWPIFSLIDYRLYLASPAIRIVLKIFLTLALAVSCFFLIEKPCRLFFNHPSKRGLAFAFLGVALLLSVPLGMWVRKANYVDASMRDAAHGGLAFNQTGKNGSLVLMGDSNGAMYGKTAAEIAYRLGLKLNVISVAAGDPLPNSTGQQPPLWLDSLSVVKQIQPDFLLLVCNWEGKLKDDNVRLEIAVKELKKHTQHLILITQPPELPQDASRESMRNGSRPPFTEDPGERTARMQSNASVLALRGDNVTVIDIEPLFTTEGGSIRMFDNAGRQLYQDADHLSGFGAMIVKPYLLKTLTSTKTASVTTSVTTATSRK